MVQSNVLLNWISRLTIILFIFISGCCKQPSLDVNARYWNTDISPNSFPEIDGPNAVPWLHDRPSFGVAFSGGGTRSATATLGQLRMLSQMGWLDEMRYMSAISGGSWAAVPYIYLPESIEDSFFLGEYVPPSMLTNEKIKNKSKGSLAHAISKTKVFFRYIREAFKWELDEVFSRTIGKKFLAPFDLNEKDSFLHSTKIVFSQYLRIMTSTVERRSFTL